MSSQAPLVPQVPASLTSIFTPPAGCATTIPYPIVTARSYSCYPPNFYDVWEFTSYYSPAICAVGYTATCVHTEPPSTPGETTAYCVPVGWTLSTRENTCVDWAQSIVLGSTSTVPAFEIRWQSSDLSRLETPPVAPAVVTTHSSDRTSTATTSPTAAPGGGGLTTGAIAGISVGIGLSVVAGIVLAVVLCLRRRRRRGPQQPTATAFDAAPAASTAQPPLSPPPAWSPAAVSPAGAAAAYTGPAMAELEPTKHVAQLSTSPAADAAESRTGGEHELEGGWYAHPHYAGAVEMSATPTLAPTSPVRSSSPLPEVVAGPSVVRPFAAAGLQDEEVDEGRADREVQDLRLRHQRLQERRRRLAELEQLEREEEEIRRRVESLGRSL